MRRGRLARVTVPLLLGLVLAGCGSQEEGAVEALAVGDCFDEPAANSALTAVPVVPCEEPHRYEMVGAVLLPDDAVPEAEVEATALESCEDPFTAYVGTAPQDSHLRPAALVPTAEGWAEGDREALCLATDPSASLVGSVAGAAR
ncbi:MAG: septum formation family protein [Nitriliruptoraceae bacterium]